MTVETLKKRLEELQGLARQQEAALLQVTGAIQEVISLIKQLEAQNAPEARNE